ncbi:MAG: 1-aminocyclopropane-1-carboxylate deaminase/D-cysteine desulfhydrase, partial [Christiangramia sp.]|nr:1-aminocyclopropane-1-carboxylate deaminase/D-cysteine desulfhydrase [Christiangramia sp.]
MPDFFDSRFSEAIPNEFIREFPGGIKLWLKREDMLHPEVSGNKFRKLKYNLIAARDQKYNTLLT